MPRLYNCSVGQGDCPPTVRQVPIWRNDADMPELLAEDIKSTKLRQCLLPLGAESFVFLCDVQEYKD